MKNKPLILSLFLFCVLFGKEAVEAQIYNPNQYAQPVFQKMYDRQFMTNIATNGLMRSQMLRDSLKSSGGGSRRRSVRDPLQFKPSGAVLITDEELRRMSRSEQEKTQIEKFFNDCLDVYIRAARRDRYEPTDVAYAFNYFVTNNYHVYKNVLRDYRGYKNRGVVDLSKLPDYIGSDGENNIYAGFRAALLKDANFMKMSDPEKEKLTAYLALMTTLAWRFYDSAVTNGDDREIENARNMAKKNLESLFDTPAENISITADGSISLP